MKPKREITLGEMQDECKRVEGNCGNCNKEINEVCDKILGKPLDPQTPIEWNLTDPPRFTEAQMALLKWWYERGARTAGLIVDHRYGEKFGALLIFRGSDSEFIGDMTEKSICSVFDKEFPNEQRIDLAELFGKEGTK